MSRVSEVPTLDDVVDSINLIRLALGVELVSGIRTVGLSTWEQILIHALSDVLPQVEIWGNYIREISWQQAVAIHLATGGITMGSGFHSSISLPAILVAFGRAYEAGEYPELTESS